MTDEEIDDVVDRWHKHEWPRLELWQALGWTREAYTAWVEGPGEVPKGPWVAPQDRNRCCLCGGNYHTITTVNVSDGRDPGPGIHTLVALYRLRPICEHCWVSIERDVVRKQQSRPATWDTWVSGDQTFAHCPARNITWELLPTGRPKKLEFPIPPPWKVNDYFRQRQAEKEKADG